MQKKLRKSFDKRFLKKTKEDLGFKAEKAAKQGESFEIVFKKKKTG